MNWTLKLEELIQKLPTEQKNIRTLSALEKLIENLDRIDIEKIEELVCDKPKPRDGWEKSFKK